jgi:hypothetical protein
VNYLLYLPLAGERDEVLARSVVREGRGGNDQAFSAAINPEQDQAGLFRDIAEGTPRIPEGADAVGAHGAVAVDRQTRVPQGAVIRQPGGEAATTSSTPTKASTSLFIDATARGVRTLSIVRAAIPAARSGRIRVKTPWRLSMKR